MKNRLNQILAGVLALQILLAAFLFWPRSVDAESDPVFVDLGVESFSSFLIENETGDVILLEKQDGEWVLPEADNFPVQALQIEELFASLLTLQKGEVVTSSVSSQRALQVAEDHFLRKITLGTEDGEQYVLYIGSSPSYGASHFRVEGEDNTYLASGLNSSDYNTAGSAWVDTSYMRVDQENLLGIRLENSSGTLSFTKNSDGTWQMDGLLADEIQNNPEVNSLLSRTTNVTLSEPLGLTEEELYGLSNPSAVVTLQTAEDTITLLVGAQDPDTLSYVVKASTSDYFVNVREYSVSSLLEYTRADFIEQPEPTPTPDILQTPTGEDTAEADSAAAETADAAEAVESTVESTAEETTPQETPTSQ